MKVELKCNIMNIMRDADGSVVYVLKEQDHTGRHIPFVQELDKGKGIKVEMNSWREKRSIDANNYAWVIQNEIAKEMRLNIDEVHEKMVMAYGVLETYSILKEALPSAVRLFDYYKVLGESVVNGKTFVHIRAGVGTHNYDSKEMAVFIDGVVEEAKQLGIETMTPAEIQKLKDMWGEQ